MAVPHARPQAFLFCAHLVSEGICLCIFLFGNLDYDEG